MLYGETNSTSFWAPFLGQRKKLSVKCEIGKMPSEGTIDGIPCPKLPGISSTQLSSWSTERTAKTLVWTFLDGQLSSGKFGSETGMTTRRIVLLQTWITHTGECAASSHGGKKTPTENREWTATQTFASYWER
ncbi:uncharacterized protein LOC129742799 [Uranotaenia lowii]|uniref:uncharacterized protein LOC129742799 n=1 Tax=Uranotaenia lowii TaxID=190385 RepID=UPI0024799CF0|nr:uncharacterized protein LOC129742799 [Uranotaenia lowii]